VGLCLHKDPTSRIKAAELLDHKFFRQARDKQYLVTHFLSGLTPATSPRVAPAAPGGGRRGSAVRLGPGSPGGEVSPGVGSDRSMQQRKQIKNTQAVTLSS
jgi:hypothetical protein